MKYIKKFENINKSPEVGDYVLMRSDSKNKGFNIFINNNIGQVVINIGTHLITIKYDNINLNNQTRSKFFVYDNIVESYVKTFNIDKVVVFSKNKEDIENFIKNPDLYQSANKYNL